MLLTESWVNAVSIAVVGASLVRLWHGVRTRQARVAKNSVVPMNEPVSPVDAYLLLEHTRENRAEIERSELCGCLYCEQLYRPSEIAGLGRGDGGVSAVRAQDCGGVGRRNHADAGAVAPVACGGHAGAGGRTSVLTIA